MAKCEGVADTEYLRTHIAAMRCYVASKLGEEVEVPEEYIMFDMNQCKPGDKLISIHGMILEYIGIDELKRPYRHIVKYPNGGLGSRCDDGAVYHTKKLPEDHDIIGIITE